jgi:hypothetical protein
MQKINLNLNLNKFKKECNNILDFLHICEERKSDSYTDNPVEEKYLFDAMKNPNDYQVSKHKKLIDFGNLNVSQKFLHIINEQFPNNSITVSGSYLYQPKSYMGWHTNSNVPFRRMYLTYVDKPNKSFFRYYDESSKKIVTDYDNENINVRIFDICDKNLFWHCVYSECNRFSFGFKIINNLTI